MYHPYRRSLKFTAAQNNWTGQAVMENLEAPGTKSGNRVPARNLKVVREGKEHREKQNKRRNKQLKGE